MTQILYIVLLLFALISCNNDHSQEMNKSDNLLKDDPSTILKLISTNPSYLPNKEEQQQAQNFLKKIYPENKMGLISVDTIEFVDAGQNLDSIICPFCGKEIETEFWQNAMLKSDQNHFTDLTFKTPCCHKYTTLNDLKYIAPAGFAKFILTVHDPETEIVEESIVALQKILNTQLRVIYAHY